MASINLLIQSKKNPAIIYIRLRDGRKIDLKAKTNFLIDPLNWDSKEQRPMKKLLKDVDFANLDTELSTLKTDVLKNYNKSKGVVSIDFEWLKNTINPIIEEDKQPETLVDYISFYIEYKKREVKTSTIAKCNVNKELLIRFEKDRKSVVYIKDVNLKFKKDFEDYCIRMEYMPNTIARAVRFFKTVCNYAKANGVPTHFQLDSIKAKYLKVDFIYLNLDEIKKIEDLEKEKIPNYLDNARDWLLISCYCGQRISDFLRFDKSMIRYEKDRSGRSIPLIEFTQFKTEKEMTFPLDYKILEIMKKYNGEFPKIISEQKLNKYIKTVCKEAGLVEMVYGTKFDSTIKKKVYKQYEKWELVSSHIGRRSFSSNNYGGVIPTSFLKYITGHSTEALLLTYIGKSNKDIAMELANYYNYPTL
jgi:integrase